MSNTSQPQQLALPFVVYEYKNPKPLRTHVDERGMIWFVAKDVCDMLDIQNVSQAVSQLDEDEKKICPIQSLGQTHGNEATICPQQNIGQKGIEMKLHGRQEINLINESGFYALVLRSNKPDAKQFRKWVTSEVLPTIRKYGKYAHQRGVSDKLHIDEARRVAIAQRMRYGWMKVIGKYTGIKPEIISGYLRGERRGNRRAWLSVSEMEAVERCLDSLEKQVIARSEGITLP